MIRRFFSSNLIKARKFMYVKEFRGEPTAANFDLVEENLPALKDGEVLAQAEYLSIDPYMRPYMMSYKAPCLMIGGQMAKIVESKNADFPVDSTIFGQFGWRSHTVLNPTEVQNKAFRDCYILPKYGNLPTSLGLGYLGMPGNTVYFGFLEICQPKEGETVVVTGAAGAVGTLVGQVAKLKGCRVIGFAGSDDKCKWLETELGFDKAINYKTKNLYRQLKDAAPKGIDCYFDNVGGEISSLIFSQMNDYGRISVCGAISSYNTEIPKVPAVQTAFVFKQLKMEGFLVWRYTDRWMEGIDQVAKWIQEGKVKYNETITEGFENTPQAFIDMLRGKNFGKAVVKV
ncbi:prostaglandin reductase 1-like isoform X1 [Chironomus tepperi]|uniref:prostaglandin reductase 1-like isoform X1 n=1 Tax=Chironomus tepperi TaxID=113505 RepID=UPI00391EE828